MKWPTTLAAAIGLLIFAQPLAAKPPAVLSEAERRQVGYDFALCIAKKNPALVKEYVLSQAQRDENDKPDKPDKRFKAFSDFECVPKKYQIWLSKLSLNEDGALYNFSEILLKSGTHNLPADLSAIPFLKHSAPMQMENYKKSGKLSEKEYATRVEHSIYSAKMSTIGECVVRGDSSGANALLSTVIGSAEEKTAIQLLLPTVAKCIESGSIKILPEQLRGTVALNMYRLIDAAAATQNKAIPDA